MGVRFEKSAQISSELALLRDMYMHMLLTRLVDECAWNTYRQAHLGFVASCYGHEAAQVGSAMCIQIGQDFTLPYYRDLGVVLTIGMTPYEVFRTYLQSRQNALPQPQDTGLLQHAQQPVSHWGYHKHNLVTGPAPVATQIMHAAGIAFACKLRKSPAVTVAYCGDGATAEPDFLEGLIFAALHQLPALFICEQDTPISRISTLSQLSLPSGLTHHRIDGSDVLAVHAAMQAAIEHARAGHGPSLLEMCVTRAMPGAPLEHDPLQRCIHLLKEHNAWDDAWASELETRLRREVKQALDDVLGKGL
ncbi:MAG: thiamine pyrophosphate-dependent dehydrogenase E1 component subunit alpha [Ktedonobacteraceae bacterium]